MSYPFATYDSDVLLTKEVEFDIVDGRQGAGVTMGVGRCGIRAWLALHEEFLGSCAGGQL